MRAAIIGTGWGSRVQVPAFRAAGFEIAGIAGRNSDRTRAVARELDVPAFDEWRRLIDDSRADLVSIVTPPGEHLEMTLAACERGLHVLCEKPTALDLGEAEQMLAASRKNRARFALIDHELRFLPTWREARRRITEVGSIRFIEVRYSSPSRGDRSRAWNWWSDAAQGGGVLGAVGSHFIDAIRCFAGEIESVRGSLHTIVEQRPSDGGEMRAVTSDDTAFVTLRLAGGAVATMSLSVVASVDDESSLTIHGEEGGLRLRGHQLEQSVEGRRWESVAQTEELGRAGNSPGGPFGTATHHLTQALAAAISGQSCTPLQPAATFEDGFAQQAVLDAARRSSTSGECERVAQRL